MVIHFKPVIFMPLLLAFPLATGIAILRYRMWDLDVIINRTLVYGLVSMILAVVYFAIIMLVHRMLNDYVQLTTEITSVSSALLIVALFNPLRRRVQDFIDRRFYRRKYDAAKTLAVFTRTLQDELDLAQLLGRLAAVVWDTIMPARLLVWLKNGASFQVIPIGDSQLLGEPHPPLETDQVPTSDPLVEHFYRYSNPAEIEELDLDTPGVRLLKSSGIAMLVPLINQGELIGWIGLGRRMSRAEYSGEDRQLLANLASQAAPALRVAQMVQQQRAEALKRERLEHELRLAREIQLALLPKRLPELGDWQLSAHYQPARAVGGDFYDFIHLEDGRLGVFIGDVTDKGVPAALVMATTRTLLRAVAQNVTSPGLVLEQVNNMLHEEIPDNMFVTCLYIILDPASGRMQFANAGHNLPFQWTCDSLFELRARGMPLGLMPEMFYEDKEALIGPGECLFLYSDGLVEAHNVRREMFGTDRLAMVMAELHDDRFPLIDCLLEELQAFTGTNLEQEDDVTMVALKRSTQERCP
jgi:serine phosphatase RsbU (regulator of sigma subunit)